ncbi:cyclic nucleotide-gated cation channel alpha-3 [Trichonephila clavipes]|nr:cyclic nucleotide-gated cation channel alpha-3 [Trichonephila clavipes]
MRHHKVPRNMQRRVQRWYDYSWSRGRMQGGGDINSALGILPDKLKTELALHVNLKTLKKVSIFQECQPEFLHDLVLKMRAYIFTPGDLICRKGEVAREMFIIADGILEVISETGKVLTQMKAGDFFGEIGILNLDGFNSVANLLEVVGAGHVSVDKDEVEVFRLLSGAASEAEMGPGNRDSICGVGFIEVAEGKIICLSGIRRCGN